MDKSVEILYLCGISALFFENGTVLVLFVIGIVGESKYLKKLIEKLKRKNKGNTKIETTEKVKNMDDENAMLVLLIMDLVYRNDSEIGKEWENFAKEIKFKSRFFPKSVLLDKIRNVSQIVERELDEGSVLYRARLYKSSYEFAREEIKDILLELQKKFPCENLSEDDLHNVDRLAFLKQIGENEDIYEVITKYKGQTEFFGYDEKNSDAPRDSSPSGRANSRNISFLYASEEPETAIMEVFPKLGQEVNLAEVKIERKIKLFDFLCDMQKISEGEYSLAMDLGSLSACFSRPNYKDELEYLPTQYICEFIRELGFEGIRFCSSVKNGGINIAIFDTDEATKPYTISNTKVIQVKDIKVEYNQIVPTRK